MLVFVMRHFVQYYSVGLILFENHKKWLESNMIAI